MSEKRYQMNATKARLNLNRAVGIQEGPVQLRLRNPHGDVTISAVESNSIVVEASIEYDAAELSEAEVRALLRLTSAGNNATLVVDKPDFSQSLKADLVVKLPSRARLALNVSLGDVAVSGMAGDIEIKASMGKVWLDGGRGKVEIETSNGAVDARNVQPDEHLIIKTSLGDISYQGLLAASGNEISATNGNITVKLPPAHQLHLSARTMVGRVYSDFPITGPVNRFVGMRVEGGSLSLASDTPALQIRAMVGDINIKQS